MTTPLKDQTVLVTGAGRGLGAAIARAFAREGAKVAINYHKSADAAEALAAEMGPRTVAVQADIRDAAAISDMMGAITDTLGPVTTVVHNALSDYSFNGDARETLGTMSAQAIILPSRAR